MLLDVGDRRWGEFVETRRDASLFHHPAWARLLADCYGYRACAAAVTDGGAIVAGVPFVDVSRRMGGRRWISLPFTDRCPPLRGERDGDLADMLAELARSERLGVLEVRSDVRGHDDVRRDVAFVRHELPLSADPTPTWKRLFKNHRRNVRIAERFGVVVERGTSAADLETFYRLHLRTRRRLGVPIQPRRFFALLLERVVRPGLGFVLTARSEGVPVAAAVFASWNGTLIYKYSARDERFDKRDANYLLLWTAIRWASENGYHTLDLGRSDLAQPQLRTFKDGWGAREEPLAYSRIAVAAPRASAQRLQGPLGMVIRNSAPWVCRALGELFYRYAA